jgi:hypothetical protein
MKYLILTQPSEEYAQAISAEIWKISKPPQFWEQNDVTSSYCGHIVHPESGDVALTFPSEPVKVHADCDVEPLVELVSAPLTEEMINDFRAQLNALKGDSALIEDVLPPVFAANLRDKEHMQSNGWFEGDE